MTAQVCTARDNLDRVRRSDLPPLPDALVSRPVRHIEAIVSGIPSAELRGPLWDRPYRGVVSWHPGATDHVWWRICAAAQLLPEGGCVGGWAAAYWQGVRMLDGVRWTDRRPAPVLLNLPPHTRRRRGPGCCGGWTRGSRRPRYCPIFDREGHLLGIADLSEPTSGTVTEYDGSGHRGRGPRRRQRPGGVLRAAQPHGRPRDRPRPEKEASADRCPDARRPSQGPGPRQSQGRWTIEPPSWWRDPALLSRV